MAKAKNYYNHGHHDYQDHHHDYNNHYDHHLVRQRQNAYSQMVDRYPAHYGHANMATKRQYYGSRNYKMSGGGIKYGGKGSGKYKSCGKASHRHRRATDLDHGYCNVYGSDYGHGWML